ncbi:hypothetical protein AVEN_178563-1, partial [Araneus ventricosus]
MTRTTPELAPPSPNFPTTPAGRRFTHMYDLVQQAQYMTDLKWNLVSNLEPSGYEADTLPLGHCGLNVDE